MVEHRTNSHPPTLDDYQAMMSDLHAPKQLKEAVLGEARARRNGAYPAPTAHRSAQVSALFKRHRLRVLVIAACIALLVGAGTTALALNTSGGFGIVNDLMAEPPSPDENATKEPEEVKENSFELDTSQFKGGGGYSGPWYNPADDSFWSYEWAGYKYHFNICCTGNNIETITYEIEGERSYFEIIDNTVTPEQQQSGVHIFHYPKTVTFDYEHQESISDDRIVEIYIGFPLSQSGLDAYHRFWAEGNSAEISDQINKAIEEGAARELIGSVLSVTVTFTDGSTQTKSYLIEAPDLGNPTQYTFTEITDN